jgi:thiamine-monophosphate kinase
MPVARDARPHINYATAMMDISDGLFMDLSRMCDESGIGVRLYLDRLPLSGQMRSVSEMIGCDPLSLATAGGEDYELLFTAPEAFSADSEGVKVTCIGEITEKDRIVIDCNGRQSYLVPEGYQHFGIS